MADNLDPETMRKFIEAIVEATAAVDEITEGQKVEKEETEKKIKAVIAFTKQVGKSTIEMGKAMTDATNSTGKYGGAIEGLGRGASDLGSKFGLLGSAVGGVIEMFTKLVSAGFKQNDALYKTYRSLAQFGDLDNADFDQLLSDLQRTGFAIGQNSDQYVAAIERVAPSLVTFAGSVAQGRKAMVDAYSYFKDTEKYFERLGFTAEEGFSAMATVVDSMAVSNRRKQIGDKELFDLTANYMENLAALNAATGISRKEAEDNIKRQQNDLRWQMYLNGLEGEHANHLRQAVMTMSKFDPKMAEGFISQMVNYGAIVDKQGIYFQRYYGSDTFEKFRAIANKENYSTLELLRAIKQSAGIAKDNYFQFQNTASVSLQAAERLGMSAESFNGILRAQGMNMEDIDAQMSKMSEEEQNRFLDEMTQRKQNERDVRNMYEQGLQSMNKETLPALTSFTDIVWSLAKRLSQILKDVGGPDFTGNFKTVSEVLKDVNVTLDEYNEKTEKLNDELKKEEKYKDLGIGGRYVRSRATEKARQAQQETAKRLLAENTAMMNKGGQSIFKSEEAYANVRKAAGEDVIPNARKPLTDLNVDDAGKKLTVEDLIQFMGGVSGDRGHFNELDEDVQREFLKVAYAYKTATGEKLKLTSAYRSKYEQSIINSGDNPKAAPGMSKHQKRRAIDIDSPQLDYLIKNGLLGGFKTLDNDKNHLELPKAAQGGYFNGPKSGYMIEQHGFEGVFNIQQLRALNNALTKTPISGGGSPTAQDSRFLEVMEKVVGVLENIEYYQRRSTGSQDKLVKVAKR